MNPSLPRKSPAPPGKVSKQIVPLTRGPENHSRFFAQFFGQVLKPAPLDHIGHAMLDTGWLETPLRSGRAENTELCWKGKEGEIGFSFWELLHLFNYLHTGHACFPPVFLTACNLTGVAPGAIFIIDQQTIFRFPWHLRPPCPRLCRSGTSSV